MATRSSGAGYGDDIPRPERGWRPALAWLVVLVTGWRAINYFSADPTGAWDSGVFASAGFFITRGLVPYRDFFDHKPPVVFYLNALGLAAAGGETLGIRDAERLFALLGGACLFALLRRVSRDLVAPLVGTLSYYFLLYHPDLLSGGNLTTEYGAAFTVAGALLWHRSGDSPSPRLANLLAWGGGTVLGLAGLTKEPFVLTGMALSPLLVRRAGQAAPAWSWRLLCGAAGALTPLLVLVTYFAAVSALGPWQDALRYNLAYVDLLGAARLPLSERCGMTARALAGLLAGTSGALTGLICIGFTVGVIALIRRRSLDLMAWLLSCAAALVALSLTARPYNHYYLQAVPVLAVTAALAVSGLQTAIARVAAPRRRTWLGIALLAPLLFVDRAALTAWLGRLAQASRAPQQLPVSAAVARLTAPGDVIWSPSPKEADTQVYAEARRLAPSRWFYAYAQTFLPYGGRTPREQKAQLLADLTRNPPRLIVIANPRADLGFLGDVGIPQWIEQHYEPVPGETSLWRRR